MKSKEQKRNECVARIEKWQQLTPEEQLKELDRRLGAGKGAKKQRAKLAALLPVQDVKVEQPKAESTKPAKKKKKSIPNGSRVVLR